MYATLVKRYRAVLVGILLLGLVLRIVAWFDLRAADPTFLQPGLDSQNFLRWASLIAGGEFASDRPFFLNPLYAYFLAPGMKIFGDGHLLAIQGVQVLLGLGTVLAVSAAVRRLVGPGTALAAAFLTAANPLLIYYDHRVMIVSLAVFLNALTLFLLARFRERRTAGSAALAGIPLGLSVLARPNVVLFALLLPIWFARIAPQGERLRFVVRTTAILFGAIALMISPVTLHNYLVGDDFVPVTSSMGVNLFQSNNPDAWETGGMASGILRLNPTLVENDAELIAEREEGRALKPSEVSQYWRDRTLSVMAENPGPAAFFLFRKFLLFFGPQEIPSSYFYAVDKRSTVLLRFDFLGYALLAPFMLLGVVAVFTGMRNAAPFVFLLLAYAVGLTIFYPLAHYRAPVLPAAIALAAIGAAQLAGAVTSGRRHRALLAGGLLLVFVLFTQFGQICRAAGYDRLTFLDRGDPTVFYNRGMILLDRGEVEAAEASFLEGLRENGRGALPHVGLAAVAAARGNSEDEVSHLTAALALEPENHTALAYLGRNRFFNGSREEGLRLARQATLRAPTDELVLAIYASLLGEAGDYEQALRFFERAQAAARYPVPDLLANQSICLRLLGRTREARSRVEEGLRIAPDHPLLKAEAIHLGLGR